MLTNYVVRAIVGPAGQIVGGVHRNAGQIISLDAKTAKAELERGVIEKLDEAVDEDGGSALGRSDVDPAAGDGVVEGQADRIDDFVDPAGGDPGEAADADLDAMTKDQLLAEAEKRGVTAKPAMSKADILAALRQPAA